MNRQVLLFLRKNILVILLLTIAAHSSHAVRDLIVNTSNSILRFSGIDGAAKGYFIAPGAGGIVSPSKMIIGPDNNIYIADSGSQTIKRFNKDGVFIDNFVPAGYVANPVAINFGPDGKLYVLCCGTVRQIHKFNGTTGAYEGLVVNALANQINNAKDFIFMPSTNDFLVVSSLNSVARFSFSTGAFISHYLNSTKSTSILNSPTSIIIGPDGNYWVTSSAGTNKITRFNISNGVKIDDAFFGPSITNGHQQMQYENGFLYVANGSANNIIAYDAFTYLSSTSSRTSKTAQTKIKNNIKLENFQKLKTAFAKKADQSKNKKAARALAVSTGDGFEFITAGSQGLSNPKNILFVDINDPPVANAGADTSVAGGEIFALNGSASYDPEGQPLTVQWSQISGPSPVPAPTPAGSPAPASGGTGSPNQQPVVYLQAPYMPTQMVFRLDVTDGVKSSFDTVNHTVTTFEDLDGDGMPDRWEEANGLNITVNDATADLDGDGQMNINEFLAGTNPSLNSSSLRVLEYKVVPGGGGFSLRFTSVIGRHYEIQSSSNLTTWTAVPGLDDVVATAPETLVVDTRPMVGRRFYRIVVKPIGF